MDPLTRLTEIEAIKALKARYFRLLDTKDWAAWTEVWAPEIDHAMDYEKTAFKGPREQFVGFVAGALDGVVTVHHGQTCEIEVLSPTEATGIWAFVDRLTPAPGHDPASPAMTGYGHYHETYVKNDGRWRIARQRVTRLRVDHHGAATSP